MKYKLLIIFICLYLVVTGCQNQTAINGIDAKLRRVVSAQTIEVIINNKSYQLRLSGLDTPSRKQQPWGDDGKKFLVDFLTANNTIPLKSAMIILETDVKVKDKFNRISGYGWFNNELINEKILAEGFGVVNLTYTDGKYDQKLLQAQSYARIMEKGIWNPKQPLRNIAKSN
ncbi:Staphylococcus nuclease (SNase) domain [Geminocystis sp. NIES-3708]|uniref:thermonuclease family protein n=1 Tax=Geminocystis sp. NIES-3708 TaxID=1615909 RepID=UPI0005FCB6B9|nr:thermonuclease family protein [Geminocystis sp. NIES-3708]BAQ62484.1 Staphylococcus nuclease (SNase) domain [Geminocystis sp. NIES-3708]